MINHVKQILFQSLIFIVGTTGFTQFEHENSKDTTDIIQYEKFLRVIENTLEEYYREYASTDKQTDSIIKSLGYDDKDVPEFSDSIYCQRLSDMNEMSPFHLDCNSDVLSVIKFFTKNRRSFTSIVLGRSKLYFPMYEEKLANHNMPIELKYLSVIESGLRPQVKSRAGALGLWQFMYRTGKYYGLEQNSYIDERMDPEMATEAACLYLKKLYSMYDDWNMALAAYNAGPGNVNKAIRRSGGKMTYWEIRPFLPRETQGYVPNFIAMSYMLTYHAEHNIRMREAKIHDFQVDTVCLKRGINMKTIDSIIKWPLEDIQALNPIYKTSYIPNTGQPQCIQVPTEYIGKWIEMEDSIYTLDSLIYKTIVKDELFDETTTVHHVRQGQTLGHIADRYGTTVKNIMDWNNMRSTRLAIGQKLTIYTKGTPPKSATQTVNKQSTSASYIEPTSGTIHTVRSGENLWSISKDNETTVDDLIKLNPSIDPKNLKVGQKLRVK